MKTGKGFGIRHLLLVGSWLVGCGGAGVGPQEGRLAVFAGVPPVAHLVERIGGSRVKVETLVQPGQDPHTFQPTPRQAHALGKAVIFFKIDMPFENVLLEKAAANHRGLMVVDATEGVRKRPLDGACCTAPDHAHVRGQPDPHVWLSPSALRVMARNIAAALSRVEPDHADHYEKNLAATLERIDAVEHRVQRLLAPYRGRAFYVFHPGFGYFADAYGLRQEAVEAGGRAPSPKQLVALTKKAREDGIRVIFAQPQYASQSAEAVARAVGGRVAMIDGLAKDVFSDIEDIAEKIEAAIKESSPHREKY